MKRTDPIYLKPVLDKKKSYKNKLLLFSALSLFHNVLVAIIYRISNAFNTVLKMPNLVFYQKLNPNFSLQSYVVFTFSRKSSFLILQKLKVIFYSYFNVKSHCNNQFRRDHSFTALL